MNMTRMILTVSAIGVLQVVRADDFLRDAARSDTIIKDVASQLESLTRDMEISNVFTPADIVSNQQATARLTTTRNTDMKEVLRALELSQLQASNRLVNLKTAEVGHGRIAQSLLELGNQLGNEHGADTGAREKLVGLKKAVEDLAAEVAAGKKDPTEEQQKRADNLARDLRANEKAMNNEDAAKSMDQAAAKLETGKPETAAEEMAKALTAMDKDSNAGDNKNAALEDKKTALEKSATDLNALAKQAANLAANPNDPQAGDKALDMMVKAEDAAKSLDSEQQPTDAQAVRDAENSLQNNDFKKAAEQLASAAQDASKQAKELSEQMEKTLQEQTEAMKDLSNAAAELTEQKALQDRVDAALQDQKEAMAGEEKPEDAAQENADKNRRADQADQLSNDLQAAGLNDPAKNVEKAESEINKDQNGQAEKSLEDASKAMANAVKNTEAKLNSLMAKALGAPAPAAPDQPNQPNQPSQPGQPGLADQADQPEQPEQPEAPSGAPSTGSTKAKDKNLASGSAGNRAIHEEQGAWKSNLRKNERQALLSGRQEKSLPSMSEDVKRYFQNLAE